MFDWNHNGKKDAFDIAVDLMILDELEREEEKTRIENDIEFMDANERADYFWENDIDPDDYDF
ncbi:MAG: hypothetical protein J6K99_02275 [Peptococcaceae bacterium]|nr:hypothetical protein [Peptococcaceae bacterium]MBO5302259.1 hypothetical protein [Peptococcaceae bacterium]MBP3341336.1 hypothetical protein [Peptococcaceae bacterium]